MPAVGYDNSNQSHFTSRHYYEVGGTDASLRTGWLGRYLDHVGTQDNPLQGLTLDVALHPSIATAKVPVATLPAADQYLFAPPGLPRTSARGVDPPGGRQHRRRAREVDATRASRQPDRSPTTRTTSTTSSAASQYGFNSPVALPELDRPVPAPARRARGDDRRRAAGAASSG